MKTNLYVIEPNTYRREAILDVTRGVNVAYNKTWVAFKSSWIVIGSFEWKDSTWCAPEYVDDECLNDKEESAYLYRCIDKALLTRLFSLKRIERRLAGVT